MGSGSIQVANTAELERAVASAGSGTTILLAPGIYAPAHTLILHASVTLAGPSVAPGARILGSNVSAQYEPDLVSVPEGARAHVENVTLAQTADDGAAARAVGSLSIANTLVAGNSGLGVVSEPEGSVHVSNSTISDNADAGIVANGTVDVASSTVTRNQAAGIDNANGGTVTLVNSIVAENGRDCASPVAVARTSLDEDGSCGTTLHAAPGLALLAANGGPTSTRALLQGSPAISTGFGCPPTDQRGAPRTQCDLGAYAFGAVPPVSSTPPSSKPPNSANQKKGPASGNTTYVRKPQANVHGNGAIRTGRALAAFLLDATNGTTRGDVAYYDRARRIRFQALRLKKVVVKPGSRSALISGNARISATQRNVGFTITISRSSRPRHISHTTRFTIKLSNGYHRAGRVLRGVVVVGP